MVNVGPTQIKQILVYISGLSTMKFGCDIMFRNCVAWLNIFNTYTNTVHITQKQHFQKANFLLYVICNVNVYVPKDWSAADGSSS